MAITAAEGTAGIGRHRLLKDGSEGFSGALGRLVGTFLPLETFTSTRWYPNPLVFFFSSVFVDTFAEKLVFFLEFSMRFEIKSHSFFIDLIVR